VPVLTVALMADSAVLGAAPDAATALEHAIAAALEEADRQNEWRGRL
jgi:hypothetical protein